MCFFPVRQVIPVIRSNETQGTPDVPYNFAGRKKRYTDADELVDPDIGFFDRPEIARKTDRAVRRVKPEVRQSRILNKRLRLLRMANLRELDFMVEKDGKARKKRSVVPRVSHPYYLNLETNRKIAFVPRFVSVLLGIQPGMY